MAIRSIAEIETEYPNLPVYWKWSQVPSHLVTMTHLKKNKLWRDDLEPCAVKGGFVSHVILLYDEKKCGENAAMNF